jgi:ElaB/YqjD/DUF883 family membrane-anchored ribosome-binding protein
LTTVNLRDLTAILGRRWLFVLCGLVLTIGVCVGLSASVPVSYIARSSLVLLPPPTVVGDNGNPYLYLGGLGQALDVLTRKLNADEISKPVEDAYPESEFIVFADTTTTGPILVIEGTGSTQADALAVMNDAASLAPETLRTLQTSLSVPSNALITVTPVAVDERPTVVDKDRIQAVGLAAAVGVILTLLLAVYRDGRVQARALRKPRARKRAAKRADQARPAPAAEPRPASEVAPAEKTPVPSALVD